MADEQLDSYMSGYTAFNDWLIGRRYKRLADFFSGQECLEMGSAEGTGTAFLLDHFRHVTVVDGSKAAIDEVTKKYPKSNLTTIHSYFEDMDFGNKKFDTIILAHILEHVENPLAVLEKAKQCLKPDGVLIVDVPNGNSLHRQIGVRMGILKTRIELNDADRSIGHRRVYLPDDFKSDVGVAGFKIKHFGGMFVKVLSNSQLEKVFDNKQLEALFEVGEDNPEIAAEIYIIATL